MQETITEQYYVCPICKSNDPNLYLRCNRPDCTDGHDPRKINHHHEIFNFTMEVTYERGTMSRKD